MFFWYIRAARSGKTKILEAGQYRKDFSEDEDPLAAAKREFYEETGIVATGDFLRLDPVKLKSGKVIYAWAVQQDLDEKSIISNEFEIEWPPKSGRTVRFPEVDKGEWFSVDQALEKANPAQAKLIQQLAEILNCT